MKLFKVLLSLICVAAVLSAVALPVCSIGFMAEDAYNSVFVVYSGNSLGSGFSIGKDCVVTNSHVIGNTKSITIKTYPGTNYKATLVGMDEEADIAVLYVPGADFSYLAVGNRNEIKDGDDVYAIGAPKSMSYTLTKGIVSAKERIVGGHSYIQIDAAVNEGNSGGPLLNDKGEVIGMNTLKLSDSEGIGLSIPIDRVCEYLKELGIELDKAGNVSENADIPDNNGSTEETLPSVPDETAPEKDDTAPEKNISGFPRVAVVISIIAIISVIGNIVLLIMLVYQKKKNLTLTYDPKERTDFEIEILE